MTPSNPLSPIDRTINITVRLLIIALTIIIWFNILQSCSGAPGAATAPHHSQNGKVAFLDRGHAFPAKKNSKHNVYSQDGTNAKLIPGSGQTNSSYIQNIILFPRPCLISFNIINIIILSPSVECSALIYPQVIHNAISHIGNSGSTQEIFSFWDEVRAFGPACEVVPGVQARCNTRVGDYLKVKNEYGV